MTQDRIKHIVCAVRGKPESRETVTRAIELTLEHDAKLTYCFVIQAEFLGRASPTLTALNAAYRKLEEMGEFSMLILVDRARRRGVKDVDYLIRKGDIPGQLYSAALEIQADLMVLGRPLLKGGQSVFTDEEFDRFVETIEKDTGILVEQVVHEIRGINPYDAPGKNLQSD
ncbi:MAG: universal stress protein [Anaerolineales bacterium]|jgi:nucleotide-binding universal stress UspA family protein